MRIRALIAFLVVSALTAPAFASEETLPSDAEKKPNPNVVVYHGQKSRN